MNNYSPDCLEVEFAVVQRARRSSETLARNPQGTGLPLRVFPLDNFAESRRIADNREYRFVVEET